MNPGDPLAQLHPLREPAAIAWWPPAPGWWLLAGLALLAVTVVLALLWQRRRRNRYRAMGLLRLQELRARFRADGNAAQCQADINALLKRVALHAYPRCEVAALHGEQWEAFLQRTGGSGQSFAGATSAHYRRDGDSPDLESLCNDAAHWIRRHEVPR